MMENNASRYEMNTMIISAYQMVFPRVGQNSGILSFQTPIAERIRLMTASCRPCPEHPALAITASFGIACVEPSDPSFDTVFSRADRALYAAKHSGRNAWVGLWGMAADANVDAALADVQDALAQDWFAVGGNRPMDWSGPRPAPAAGSGTGPVRTGGSSR